MVRLDPFQEVNFGLETGKKMNLYVYKDFEELNSSSLQYCIHRKRCVVRLTKEEAIFILMLKLFGILSLNSY